MMSDMKKSKDSSHDTGCAYVSTKSGERCTNKADVPWGYCRSHKKTLVSRRAEKKYLKESANVDIVETERDVTPTDVIKQVKQKTVTAEDITDDSESSIKEKKGKKKRKKKEPSSESVHESISEDSDVESSSSYKKKRRRKKTTGKRREITVNSFGNYEDPVTHIIFKKIAVDGDAPDWVACGYQRRDGSVGMPLTKKLIKECKLMNWVYVIINEEEEDDDYSVYESASDDYYSDS